MKNYFKKSFNYRAIIWILSFLVVIQAIFIVLLLRSRPKKIPPRGVAFKGKIAIVIDDFGYNLHNLALLEEINYPLNVSILPNLSYSETLAKEFHRRGYEIILHLPLEPEEKFRLENNTILTSMDEETIRDILSQDLASVRYPRGVSNHMGSKATQDLKTVQIIFAALKNKRLYFLDSLVSPKSICRALAKKMKVAFAQRDIFLDNQPDTRYIKQQINKLRLEAWINGQAIGIGHDRKLTLEVLREAIPELEKEGYRLVFLSELVR